MVLFSTGGWTWLLFDVVRSMVVATLWSLQSGNQGARQVQGSRGLAVFDRMRQQGLQPGGSRSLQLFNGMRPQISACGKCRPPERALQLFDEMQLQGLQPNVITVVAAFR